MATFPSSPPYLCESLDDAYGMWSDWPGIPGVTGTELSSLSDPTKPSNFYSIRKWELDESTSPGTVILYFKPPYVNFSLFEKIAFSHYNNGFLMPFKISLGDINGNWSTSQQWTSPQMTWIDIAFFINNFLPLDPGFDITNVMMVRIDVTGYVEDPVFPKEHFVDWMFLHREPVQHATHFESIEEGTGRTLNRTVYVSGSLGTVTVLTPETLYLWQENGTQYVLNVSQNANFANWEDGSTNPIRTYIPTEDRIEGVNPIVAYYTAVTFRRVTIQSNPPGKVVKIDGATGTTELYWDVPVGQYTIELVDTEGFIEWENGETNPIRTINVSDDIVVTANYAGGRDGISPLLVAALLGMGLVGVFVAIKLFRRRRKR